MKRTLLLIVSILSFAALSAQEEIEVVTGPGYVNDIFYSFENGNVDTVAKDNWDIAFTTDNYSISILANTVGGVELYTWDLGDNTDWANLDTTGMDWVAMYNSLESWDEGAFSVNALGHPDYGWGIFTMGGDYPTVGDSLFVIKTINGNYKKLDIISYAALTGVWQFRFANLDGTDEENVTFNVADYNTKNFVYYSLDSAELVDREPASADWDLVFTQYTENVQMGMMSMIMPVSVVLSNEEHIKTVEVRESGMDQASFNTFEYTDFFYDTTRYINIIGRDWKSFDGMSYSIIDTIVYFVKDSIAADNYTYYKIYFTDFSGSSEGKYTFMQEVVFPVFAKDFETLPVLELYPNPATDFVNVVFDHQGELSLQVIDMTGRTVYRTTRNGGGLTDISLDIAGLNPGIFFLKLDAGGSTNVLRFIKQ